MERKFLQRHYNTFILNIIFKKKTHTHTPKKYPWNGETGKTSWKSVEVLMENELLQLIAKWILFWIVILWNSKTWLISGYHVLWKLHLFFESSIKSKFETPCASVILKFKMNWNHHPSTILLLFDGHDYLKLHSY